MKHLPTFIIGCITGAAAFAGGMAFQGTWSAVDTPRFAEIDVGRINVIEPDGTPRLIISSKSRFPGSFVAGEEIARPDRREYAGILFVNDEGTENGGFVQSGVLTEQGVAKAALSLTFDRFRQDQTLQLLQTEGDGRSRAGIVVNDRPDHKVFSVSQLLELADRTRQMSEAERNAELQPYLERGDFGRQRAYLGTTNEGDSALVLRDPQGRPRLRLLVTAAGEPRIEILDASGAVVKSLDANVGR